MLLQYRFSSKKMTIWRFGFLVIAFSYASCTAASDNMTPPINAQENIAALRGMVASRRIFSMEICHDLDDTAPTVATSKDSIDRHCDYKIAIGYIPFDGMRKDLEKVLSSTRVYQSTRSADLRWKLTFFDDHGESVGRVYLNNSGEAGYINDEQVTMNNEIIDWLGRNFPTGWR